MLIQHHRMRAASRRRGESTSANRGYQLSEESGVCDSPYQYRTGQAQRLECHCLTSVNNHKRDHGWIPWSQEVLVPLSTDISPRRRDRRLGETHSSPQPRQNAVSIARSESPRICTLWLLSMVRSLLVLSLVKVDSLALVLVAVILPTSPCGCYPWFWHGSLISIAPHICTSRRPARYPWMSRILG